MSRANGNTPGVRQSLYNDRYISDTNRVFVGLILSANGQNSEGYYTTELTTYDISAAIPDSVTITTIRNQVPSVRLWPRNHYLDSGKLIGTHVVGFMLGDVIRWLFYEPALVEECSPPAPPSPGGLAAFGTGGLVSSSTGSTGSGPGGGNREPVANPGES